MVAIKESCPKAHLPTHGPARRGIAASHETGFGSFEEVGGTIGRNLVARVEPPKVRDVAVMVAWIIPILHPLLQLTPSPYLHGSEFAIDGFQRIDEESIVTHLFCRADAVSKKVVDKLVVHGGTIDDGNMSARE